MDQVMQDGRILEQQDPIAASDTFDSVQADQVTTPFRLERGRPLQRRK
jgi:hypothetical protein